jgi:DnaJ like chaperone protein
MSIWHWIGEAAEGGAGAFGALLAWTGGLFGRIGDPAERRQVAFSMALIALSAKMAKADGIVTASEVAAFRQMFAVPAGEEAHVRRLFDFARQDVAGYEAYAARIAALYRDDPHALADVVDGLFVIAKADGAVHEAELTFLANVAQIFGIDEAAFQRIKDRHVVPEEGDPYLILGVERGLPFPRIRRQYLRLVRENHPDRLTARGVPAEFIALANDRLAAINRAFERIEREWTGTRHEAGA